MAVAKRELFKSPDVCEMAQLQPYVLRSWEAEFPGLGKPATAGAGRVYRRADIEMVLRIKQLVFVEGLTLAGARRRLEEDQQEAVPSIAARSVEDMMDGMARSKLHQLREGLEAILRMVSRGADREPAAALELELGAPPRPAAKAGVGKRRRAS
ncbi:MAG: MerR family transcriptional regulator [Acidobacteria bacterium]|nr:MerR family transcriptional regulator [Acidobacteriota bacterium]